MAYLVEQAHRAPTSLEARRRQLRPRLVPPLRLQQRLLALAPCSHPPDKPLPQSLSSIPSDPPPQPVHRLQTHPSQPLASSANPSNRVVREKQSLLDYLEGPRNQQPEEVSLVAPVRPHLHSLLQARPRRTSLVVAMHLLQHQLRNPVAYLVVRLAVVQRPRLLQTSLVVQPHPSLLNLLLVPVLLVLLSSVTSPLRRRHQQAPQQLLLRQLLEVFSLASAPLAPLPARLRLQSLPCFLLQPPLHPQQRLLLFRLRASRCLEHHLPPLPLRRLLRLPRVSLVVRQRQPRRQRRLLPPPRRVCLVQRLLRLHQLPLLRLRQPLLLRRQPQRLPLAPPLPLLVQTRRQPRLKTPPRQQPTCPPRRWDPLPKCLV